MKVTVTIGIDSKGKYLVVNGPSDDVDGQKAAIKAITNDGGKCKVDGKPVQLAEACVVHSTKGMLARRKF